MFRPTERKPAQAQQLHWSIVLAPGHPEVFRGFLCFALDEALMCDGSFLGRSDEFIVWGYGDDSASRFNGVVLLGSQVDPLDIQERNGLRYTCFQRTLTDALENERILDMQGITEALSKYYYTNGNSFNGLFIAPKYQERFKRLADDAIKYHED